MESPRRDLSSASSASSVSVDSVSSRGTSPGLHRQLAGSECDSMGQNGNPGQDFSRLHLELGQSHALHEHSAPSDSSGQKDAQPIQALPTFAPLQPFNLSSAYHTPIIQSTTSTSSISGSSALSESSSSGDSEVSPPGNFAEVVPGLYRSSFPHEKHFPYLRSLGLKTILTFVQDEYPTDNIEFYREEGINFIQIGMPGNKEDDLRIPDESIERALRLALDTSNYPMLMHCNKGKHRTGVIVGCLRKLQQWDSEEILEEYRHYSFPKCRTSDQHCISRFQAQKLRAADHNLPLWMHWTPEKNQDLCRTNRLRHLDSADSTRTVSQASTPPGVSF